MSLYAALCWIPVLGAFGLVLAGWFRLPGPWHGVAAGAAVLGWFVIDPVAHGLRGLLAEPSAGLVVLCALRGTGTWQRTRALAVDFRPLLAVAAMLGILLYPLALGLGPFDPYAIGYGVALPVVFALGALAAWWLPRFRAIALWWTIALAAHGAGLGESSNLWDYLLDPVLFVLGFGWTIGRFAHTRKPTRFEQSTPETDKGPGPAHTG